MTTGLITQQKNNKAGLAAMPLLSHVLGRARTNGGYKRARTDNEKVREKSNQQFYLMREQEHALEKEGWQRSLSATIALLRRAHLMIDEAESRIHKQEERIARLEHMATSDELTGLKNRRGFFDAFVRELNRCERGLSKGGLLVLVDLDNFKAVNDGYGHMAGDACLRLVGQTLRNEIRTMDVAGRLGGDEFVLLLSNTTKREAAARAQGLAWQLNNLAMAWYGDEIPVRASLGLQSYRAGDTAEKIFNAADIQLYTQKKEKVKNVFRNEKDFRMES